MRRNTPSADQLARARHSCTIRSEPAFILLPKESEGPNWPPTNAETARLWNKSGRRNIPGCIPGGSSSMPCNVMLHLLHTICGCSWRICAYLHGHIQDGVPNAARLDRCMGSGQGGLTGGAGSHDPSYSLYGRDHCGTVLELELDPWPLRLRQNRTSVWELGSLGRPLTVLRVTMADSVSVKKRSR